MRALGVVPARAGSTRAPGKNMHRLGGTTLVRRALETSLASGAFDTVALSSDDDEILAEARGLPVVAVKRPPELATAEARVNDVVRHVLAVVGGDFDAVAIVQATSPFTTPDDIAGTVALLASTGAESAVSVVRLDAALHPAKLKRLEGDRLLPYLDDDRLTPSHELPPLWVRNGSVYAFRRDVAEAGIESALDVRGYEMPPERSLDIDTPRDLLLAELMLAAD